MNDRPTAHETMLELLKVLGDEQRLTMIGMMHSRERTVSELAAALGLTEPTISQHISRLHGAGLLRLRMAGTERFYALNTRRLDEFKRLAARIENLPEPEPEPQSDNGWIDALDPAQWSEADKAVLAAHTFNGRLQTFPEADEAWRVILRWLASKFTPGERFSEKHVNAMIATVHPDWSLLRRELIDWGLMEREGGGGVYWLKGT